MYATSIVTVDLKCDSFLAILSPRSWSVPHRIELSEATMRSATKTNVFITSDSEVLRDGVAVVDVCLHVCSRQYVGITSERFAGGHDFRACQGDVFNSSLYQNKGARLATLCK